jgi:hypothetical protein
VRSSGIPARNSRGYHRIQLIARLFDSRKAFCVGWTVADFRSSQGRNRMRGDTTRNDSLESKPNQPRGRCAEN